jgi:large subunit ribosomal protein L6
MPLAGEIVERVEVPDGVQVSLQGDEVVVRSGQETLSRVLRFPGVTIETGEDEVRVRARLPSKREKAMVGTFRSHIRNMIRGVTEGFRYEMKIVYSHFPMKVAVKGSEVVIDNFLGERHPRRARILGKTKVAVKGDQVVLTGPSLEDVAQTAANIEQATRIKGFDPRVFQDGVYIVHKGKEA